MTRNLKVSQICDVVTGPPKAPHGEPYQLASWAKRYAAVMKGEPLDWARSIHTMCTGALMGPKRQPCDADDIGTTLRPDHRVQALAAVARGENELRLRALVKALRMLSASADAKDNKMSGELGKFLELTWGIKRAYETVSEGDADLYDLLREQWGEGQLPPAGATVNLCPADELLIAAAVRRLA